MKSAYLLIYLMLLGVSTTITPPPPPPTTNTTTTPQSYVPGNPIHITHDSDFEDLGFPGDGTENSPYLIENYIIQTKAIPEYDIGIWVSGTSSHFVIRNCRIKGDESSEMTQGLGILMHDVSNGRIESNTFEDLYGSMSFQSNLLNCVIEGNHFKGEDNNEHRCTLGVTVAGPNLDLSLVNNIFDDMTTAIRITKSEVSIINNTLSNNMEGLTVYSSSEIVVSGNTIMNGGVGLSLGINNSIVSWNIVSGNVIGAYLVGSDNLLTNNSFALSREDPDLPWDDHSHGLVIDSRSADNSIIWNDFIDNPVSVRNDGNGTAFDFNYYSDYSGVDEDADGIGDTPYEIEGESPTLDNHPRMSRMGHTPLHDLTIPFLMAASLGCVIVFYVILRKKS